MKKELAIYKLDAFTREVFRGNPAGVVPLKQWLPDAVMAAIAAENNLPETAFFVPTPDGEEDFHLRWFTPTVEVDLCGHATLASAAVLFDKMGFAGERVRFASRSGPLSVTRDGDARYVLDFPAMPADEAPVPEGLKAAIGDVQVDAYYTVGEWRMAVLRNEAAVRAIEPNLAAITALGGFSLIVTAPGNPNDPEPCHVASRMLAPAAGIDEDPVTGSAHCVIVPYWSKRLGLLDLHCRQVSDRSGDLFCELKGDRVTIAGYATHYLEGRIFV